MVAIVTGASSGFGYEVCRMLAEKGHKVYGLSRRGTAPTGVCGLSADMTSQEETAAAVQKILQAEGRVDILINNAGMGISGPIEFAAQESIDRMIQVNFLGALSCTQAVLPHMRAQKSGHIVFVSSVAAEIAIPYQAMYSVTKAGLTALALALRNEVKEFGIAVTAVEPGDAKTGFTDSREKETAHDDVYPHNRTATASMEKDERSGMPAAFVAEQIVKAALSDSPKPVYTVGAKYKLFTLLFRFLPRRLSYRIVGKLYA